ncbi:hypothetical protein ACL9RF_13785 [Sphingobacterium sp. Mn56C]|uniref:hypothetical protein n=1 Tax=Sphingobacterium sp. Mn56C TaxID=3395261 RepID=UPI003BEC8EE9
MKQPDTQELNRHIGQLFSESLKVSSPVQMLHTIREKMNARGYQYFDKEDILNELGQLQRIMGALNSEMLHIYELLKK